jgi:CheY-like chemotaxis protein
MKKTTPYFYLIDDNPGDRYLIKNHLRDRLSSVKISEFQNGEEAITNLLSLRDDNNSEARPYFT